VLIAFLNEDEGKDFGSDRIGKGITDLDSTEQLFPEGIDQALIV